MLIAQYEVGLKANKSIALVSVNGIMLDASTVLTCDLEDRVTGSDLILGLAYNDDIEDGLDVPYEWIKLPDVKGVLLSELLAGKTIPLVEETTGEVHALTLSTKTQKVS